MWDIAGGGAVQFKQISVTVRVGAVEKKTNHQTQTYWSD